VAEHPIKAVLFEIDATGKEKPGSRVPVQFNPETLKVTFANQVVPPKSEGGGDQSDTSRIQYVGKGTSKLSVQLWFDVTSDPPESGGSVDDVRQLTSRVAYFITPHEVAANQFVPPAVRFAWGSFLFDGIVESLDESLEFFSPEGKPLRASVSLSITQQGIHFVAPGGGDRGRARTPGTRPLAQAPAGASVQQVAADAGRAWQDIAAANGIENPRMLAPGQLVDLAAGR